MFKNLYNKVFFIKTNMKIYNINFDTVSITIVLDDNQNLFDFLIQSKDRIVKTYM